jgi:hypothetical protein
MTTGYVRSFKELRVYQKAREVSRTVFKLSKAFPREEMLHSMIEKSDWFCGSPDGVLREDATDYFTAAPTDD